MDLSSFGGLSPSPGTLHHPSAKQNLCLSSLPPSLPRSAFHTPLPHFWKKSLNQRAGGSGKFSQRVGQTVSHKWEQVQAHQAIKRSTWMSPTIPLPAQNFKRKKIPLMGHIKQPVSNSPLYPIPHNDAHGRVNLSVPAVFEGS